MIDRIDMLQDADGSVRETRIRLSPDRLGQVDIAIEQTADGVNVRFVTDNPQARALLADAQPRLMELAESRGLKLGGGGVGDGRPERQGHDAPPRSFASNRPADASAAAPSPTIDTRIA